jgi:predicted ATPase
LDCALQAGLIDGSTSQDQYGFRHPFIREVIYAEMLSGVRQSCHRRAANVLERRGFSGALDERLDLLAHHFLQADEREKAIAYLARATRRARLLCAPDAALNYVDTALALVEQLDRTARDDYEHQQRRKQRADLAAVRAKLEEAIAQQHR